VHQIAEFAGLLWKSAICIKLLILCLLRELIQPRAYIYRAGRILNKDTHAQQTTLGLQFPRGARELPHESK